MLAAAFLIAAASTLYVRHTARLATDAASLIDADEQKADTQIFNIDSIGCQPLRAALLGRFGATLERISPSGDAAILHHPLTDSLSLSCIGQKLTNVSLSKDGLSIPKNWFALAGQAGAIVTGNSAQGVEALVKTCIDRAFGDESEHARVDGAAAHVECQAFKRDGGNVNVSIYRP